MEMQKIAMGRTNGIRSSSTSWYLGHGCWSTAWEKAGKNLVFLANGLNLENRNMFFFWFCYFCFKYLSAIHILRNHELYSYPLHKILSKLSDDVESLENDPELLTSVLTAIRYWLEQSRVSWQLQHGVLPSTESSLADWKNHVYVCMCVTFLLCWSVCISCFMIVFRLAINQILMNLLIFRYFKSFIYNFHFQTFFLGLVELREMVSQSS